MATLACLAAALLLGAGSSWVSGPPLVFTITSMQAVWAVGACLSGALVGGRRPRLGAISGGCFGLVAIGAYYAAQWYHFGAQVALRQLTGAGGEFWVTAAVIGGALMGANGVVLTRWPTGRLLDPTAMAHAVLAGVLACEAFFVLAQLDHFGYWQQLREVCVALLVLAVLIGLRALVRSGWKATSIAFAVAMACAPIAAGVFLFFEHRYGYFTV